MAVPVCARSLHAVRSGPRNDFGGSGCLKVLLRAVLAGVSVWDVVAVGMCWSVVLISRSLVWITVVAVRAVFGMLARPAGAFMLYCGHVRDEVHVMAP